MSVSADQECCIHRGLKLLKSKRHRVQIRRHEKEELLSIQKGVSNKCTANDRINILLLRNSSCNMKFKQGIRDIQSLNENLLENRIFTDFK